MTRLFEAKPWIVANVGSNWREFVHAKDSISLAKNCGADAVLFDAFSCEALYGMPFDFIDKELGHGEVAACEAYNRSLPLDWLHMLRDKATACDIELMVTAHSPELLALVNPFVEVHSVSSGDLSHVKLLQAVAGTGKPVLLNVGASSTGDVRMAVNVLQEAGCVQLTLLYSNEGSPSRRHNLYLIDALREMFSLPVGLNDRSLDVIYAPIAAVKTHGATVIQKNFTAVPDLDTPDRGHSLTSDEFKIMTDYLRGKRTGDGFNPTSEEKDMFLKHNRRLVTTKDVVAGEVLEYGVNFGAYRSLKDDVRGFSPFILLDAQATPDGKYATKAIPRGEGVGPGDFGVTRVIKAKPEADVAKAPPKPKAAKRSPKKAST